MGLLPANMQDRINKKMLETFVELIDCQSEVTGERIQFIVFKADSEKVKKFFNSIEEKYKKEIVKNV